MLILISLAFNVFSTVFKTNVVFHIRMLWKRKFHKTGNILNVSIHFSFHECGTLLKVFFYSIHLIARLLLRLWLFSRIILFISNWSLQTYGPHLHPFRSSGNRPLSIRNEYVYSVKIDVMILYVAVKQVTGR